MEQQTSLSRWPQQHVGQTPGNDTLSHYPFVPFSPSQALAAPGSQSTPNIPNQCEPSLRVGHWLAPSGMERGQHELANGRSPSGSSDLPDQAPAEALPNPGYNWANPVNTFDASLQEAAGWVSAMQSQRHDVEPIDQPLLYACPPCPSHR
ncbi:hypothetical protein BDV06DRAFT_223430 [Aspergillus oleicola]